MKTSKTVFAVLLALSLVSVVSATPDEPFEVYGTVMDTVGDELAEGVEVQAYETTVVETDTTDGDGYYSIIVDSSDFSEGDEFEVRVEDFDGNFVSETVEFRPFGVENIDFEVALSGGEEEEEEQESDIDDFPELVEFDGFFDEETGVVSGDFEAIEGQVVKFNIPEEGRNHSKVSQVESVSATASGDSSISFSVSDVDKGSIEDRRDNQLDYRNISVGGIVSNQVIEFSVRKNVLNEQEVSPERIIKERFVDGEWNVLETSYVGESDERYVFEAEAGDNSLFAVSVEEGDGVVEGPNIQVTGIEAVLDNDKPPAQADITVEAENQGQETGEREIEVLVDRTPIGSEEVELDAEESTSFTIQHTFEQRGIYTISSGEIDYQIEIGPDTNSLYILLIILISLMIATGYYHREKLEKALGLIDESENNNSDTE